MISKLIKGTIFLALSFIILSAPIKGRTFFELIEGHTRPYVGNAYEEFFDFVKERFRATSRYIKKLISNSNPIETSVNDMAHNLEFMDKTKKVFYEKNQNKVQKDHAEESDLYDFMVTDERTTQIE